MLEYINNTEKNHHYLRVHDGIIVEYHKGQEKQYNVISGRVLEIRLREEEIRHKKQCRWHLLMEDEDETYDLSFSLTASTFVSVVRNLASQRGLDNLDNIKIKVYPTDNGCTNVCMWGNEKRLDWNREVMPTVKIAHRNGREVIDNEEMMEWIEGLVERINTRLSRLRGTDKKPAAAYGRVM